jgi:hypothetical protein
MNGRMLPVFCALKYDSNVAYSFLGSVNVIAITSDGFVVRNTMGVPENAETNPCDMPERTLWASHYRLMVPLYKFGPERDRSKSPRQCTASTTVTRMHPMLRYRIRRILYAP